MLTKEMKSQFEKYPLLSQDGLGLTSQCIVMFRNTEGPGVWLITEGSSVDDDWHMFGLCHITDWEFGYVSLRDIEKQSQSCNIEIVYPNKPLLQILAEEYDEYYLVEREDFNKYLEYVLRDLNVTEFMFNKVESPNRRYPALQIKCYDDLYVSLNLDWLYKLHCDANSMHSVLSSVMEEQETVYKNDLKTYRDVCFQGEPKDIIAHFVPYEENRDILDKFVYELFGDIALVFRGVINSENGLVSYVIRKDLAEHYGMSLQSLKEKAFNSSKEHNKYKVINIQELLKERYDVDMDEVENRDIPMFVVSNECGVNGSGGILSKVFEDFVDEYGTDFILLPSSIHEFIAIPAFEEFDKDSLSEMVHCVNKSCVPPGDILSNSIYFYSKDTKTFRIM